jgi:hypothetical protein
MVHSILQFKQWLGGDVFTFPYEVTEFTTPSETQRRCLQDLDRLSVLVQRESEFSSSYLRDNLAIRDGLGWAGHEIDTFRAQDGRGVFYAARKKKPITAK